MDTRKILSLYNARDPEALALTAQHCGAYCRSIARAILPSPEDAEECVNDTYLRAWNAIPPHQPENFKAFLGKLTRNLALDRYKKLHAQKRDSALTFALDELSDCVSDREDVTAILDGKELSQAISAFLETLSKKKRGLFIRRYWYVDSIPALAQQFHMTEGGVSTSLHRIRKSLQNYLSERGFSL